MAISLAVCILHNVAVLWRMPEPPEERDPPEDQEEIVILEEDDERAEVRARAEVLRNRLRENMPPATEAETRKM